MGKRIEWSHEKNEWLKQQRGLSFEGIAIAIDQGKFLDMIPHPNPQYAHQQIYVLDIEGVIVLVPFVEDETRIFLKTAFPSRKAAKMYQRMGGQS